MGSVRSRVLYLIGISPFHTHSSVPLRFYANAPSSIPSNCPILRLHLFHFFFRFWEIQPHPSCLILLTGLSRWISVCSFWTSKKNCRRRQPRRSTGVSPVCWHNPPNLPHFFLLILFATSSPPPHVACYGPKMTFFIHGSNAMIWHGARTWMCLCSSTQWKRLSEWFVV